MLCSTVDDVVVLSWGEVVLCLTIGDVVVLS